MTVTELRAHQKRVAEQKRKHKLSLKEKEREEKEKFEKWKIERKYKQKRKATKSGKTSLKSAKDLITKLGGSGVNENYDPFGVFGPPTKVSHKKKTKKRKKKR